MARAISLLLLLAGVVHLQQASALYHTSSEVLHWFKQWSTKRSDLLRFRELHERQSKTVLPVATISKGINSLHHKPRPAVLFAFGEHAREVITPEVGIWLARILVDANSSVYTRPELSAAFERAAVDADGRSINSSSSTTAGAASSSSSSKQDWPTVIRGWVSQLSEALEIVIVPIEALDSRRLVESGQLCVRKTASNVDLNRNWPYAWKKEAATDEQYGGANPFSEPQSRLMKHLMDHLTGRLLGYVAVHSGEWALYTPWDSKPAYGPGLPADLPDLVAKVGRLCNCKAGPAGAVSGYLAFGTSMDYLYVHKRVPYPLTVEVYGGDNIGKLAPGETNKVLDAWPTVTKSGAPTNASAQFQHRRLQQTAAQQEGSSIAQHSMAQGLGRRLLSWTHQQLQAAGSGDDQPSLPQEQGSTQLQQQQQQQQRHRLSKRRRRRRHRLQQVKAFANAVESGDGSVLPLLPDAAAVPAGGLADVDSTAQHSVATGGGFSAGGNLEQLKQQARQQMLQTQQQQQDTAAIAGAAGTLSIPIQLGGIQTQEDTAGTQQQQQQDGDAILALLTSASPPQRNCFTAFNPVSEAEYRRVVADWLAASLIMMKHMVDGQEGQQMIVKVASGGAEVHRGGSSSEQHSGSTVRERSGLLPDSSSSSGSSSSGSSNTAAAAAGASGG